MKKSLGFAALVLFTVNMIPGASLTLIQPNGGDLCLGQENFQIQWTAVGVSEKIKLVLFRNDVKIASIAENLDAAGSPYLWKVGKYIGGTASAGDGYKVRIRTMSNGIDDYSDAAFTLKTSSPPCLPPPPPLRTLKVVSPNGGESWARGSEHTISWTSTNLSGNVQLQLYRHPCCFVGVIAENLPASGSFTWKVGEYPGNTAPYGEYNIRILYMVGNTISDMSDSPFAIKSQLLVAPRKPIPSHSKPDLVVCGNATVYTPVNTPGTFHVHVRNIGGSPAKAPFVVVISIKETHRVIIETDLAPGETRWVGDYSASYSGVVVWSFVAKVDDDDVIKEANEHNNILHGRMFVGDQNPVAIPFSCSDDSLM